VREPLDAARLNQFMREWAAAARGPARVFLVGGATAVLMGWRASTVDVDLRIEPERDELLRAIPALKDSLHLNVELASPSDFIPELPGWRDRSPFAAQSGQLSFHHYDLYAQALAKLERGHAKDLEDVRQMLERGLVERPRLLELFAAIEPQLYRFPAINPARFRASVEAA
jgi:hypothetical protein